MKPAIALGMAAALAWGTSPVMAAVLAEWTFEVSIPTTAGPHAAEGGINAATSFARGQHLDGATTYSNPVGNGSAESFSSDRWAIGDVYRFETSTTGYESITISWDQTRSNTGPGTFDLQWSTNGTSFTTLLLNYDVPVVSWSSGTHQAASSFGPIAGPTNLDDQPTIYFRLRNKVTAGGTGGTNRVDNIVIEGTLIPEPATLALMGLGGLMLRRRRN